MQAPTFHTFQDFAEGYPLPGIVVPQEVFLAQARERFTRRHTIRFFTRGAAGIRLASARDMQYVGLTDANTTPELTEAQRVTVRILVRPKQIT